MNRMLRVRADVIQQRLARKDAASIAASVAQEARSALDKPGGHNDEAALTVKAETAEGIAAQIRAGDREGGK
jgi:hypothetical protein